MKKRVFIAAGLIAFSAATFTSCDSNELTDVEKIEIANAQEEEHLTNYLRFSNVEMLENYMDSCANTILVLPLQKKMNANGFKSIADLRRECIFFENNKIAKSLVSLGEDEIEDMTEDEYNLMKAEDLIYDNSLSYVLDTTLRVCVDNILYKITPYGTFSAEENCAAEIENAINTFDTTLMYTMELGSSVILSNGVEYTRSFTNHNEEDIDDIVAEQSLSKDFAANSFHNGYNVDSYKWKNHSLFKSFMDWMRGKKVSRERNFNKNKRIQVKVFEVNYKFYASTGIKVRVQKRKKFLGIPYWKETSAEKIALGFNGLEAEFKYNNPKNYTVLEPTMSSAFGRFTKTLNNIPVNFIYSWVSKIDFLKDWTRSGIYFIMPEIRINDQNYREQVLNKVYTAEIKEISNLPKLITNHYFSEIKKQIKPKDPMVAYLVWGNSSTTFNKERPYITGVEEYNENSKSVIFDRSFGITIKNKYIGGFLPTQFVIKKLDVFGAAYCDGQWLGIRFYYE